MAVVVARRLNSDHVLLGPCTPLSDRALRPTWPAASYPFRQRLRVYRSCRPRRARQDRRQDPLYGFERTVAEGGVSREKGSPWEPGHLGRTDTNESCNSKLRHEILNTEMFSTLKEAKVPIKRWRHRYNTIRPHSSPGYRPPAPEASLPNVEGPTYAVDGLRLAHQLNPRQTLT